MIPETFLTPGWISLFLSIIGFISFYLGKIFLGVLPAQEGRSSEYIFGFVLFLIYIAIPFLLIYEFQEFLILDLNKWQIILFSLVVVGLSLYYYSKYTYFKVKQYAIESHSLEIANNILTNVGLSDIINHPFINKVRNFFLTSHSQTTNISLSYILIILLMNIFFYFDSLVLRALLLLIFIANLNYVVVLHMAKRINFPLVELIDVNNKLFRGTLTKQGERYVILSAGEATYKIPRENVLRITQKRNQYDINDLFKKNWLMKKIIINGKEENKTIKKRGFKTNENDKKNYKK